MVTIPENGSCEVIDNQVLYAPAAGFICTDRCEYTVCIEGTDICDKADVVVDVVETTVAEDDPVITPTDKPVIVDVTENDSNPDPDKPLEVTEVSEPENGICEVGGDVVMYTPDAGFVGTDSCEYTVCVEGTTSCDTADTIIDVVE